jgi:integrase
MMGSVAMVTVKYPYVYEDVDRHGNVRVYYWRKGGNKIRLREKLGSPEFSARYHELLAGGVPPGTPDIGNRMVLGTWRWLCEEYMRSDQFRGLDRTTREKRRGILESTFIEPIHPGAVERFGDMPFVRMTAKCVRVLRDRKGSALPAAANLRIKNIGYVFAWAIEEEIKDVTSNPARDVPKLKGATDGYHTWTPEEIDQYESRHPIGTQARLAMAIFRYMGVRKSDAVRLGKQHAPNGWFRFRAYKNRNRNPVDLEIPILPELQAIIAASPTGDLTYLVTDFGRPFSIKGFGNKFRGWCNEAGLPHCSAHGLRKAAATKMAEAGASANQLMSWFGWKSIQEAERYTKAASNKKMAGDCATLLRRGGKGTKLSHRK